MERIIGTIELGTVVVYKLIDLRFLLKLMTANPANAFAQLVHFLTASFLAISMGLTETSSFEGMLIEFCDLIAILV